MKRFILIGGGLTALALTPLANNKIIKPNVEDFNYEPIKSDIFDYTYKSFSHYNHRIDTNTVELFIDVAKKFDLYSDTTLFELCISQICAESGAKQYYDDGSLVVSSGNAIGFSQIVPNTGYLFLKNVISKNDSILKSLGGDDYTDIINKRDENTRAKVITWLSNKQNNIIMWGYIMRYHLDKSKDVDESLMAYNQGEGYVRRFLKKNKIINEFVYVKKIKQLRIKLRKLFNS